MPDPSRAGGDPVAAGWAWLATLPRTAVAHADRGADPLASIRALLRTLDDPHERIRAIHIAGSKGKGSTALYIEALLGRLGQRTLTYTSPHLVRWTERFRIDGREADADTTLATLERVRQATEASGIRAGFFEALTATAFLLAAEASVDRAIIETGVGGRADATNVVQPEIAVLTTVESEHTDRLGNTLAAIAREKAGIIKAQTPIVVGDLAPGPLEVVRSAVRETAATPTFVGPAGGRQADEAGDGPDRVDWALTGTTLHLRHRGGQLRCRLATASDEMAGNAALALTTLLRLGLTSGEGLQRAARALAGLRLPGRMERIDSIPPILIDGAHTEASARALAKVLAAGDSRDIVLILSVSSGKDLGAIAGPLLTHARCVIATCADATYSMPAATLAAALASPHRHPLPISTAATPADAISMAVATKRADTLVVATGSVYLAGAIRGLFHA